MRLLTYSIKMIINDMFEIFTYYNLLHQLIFTTIHSSKLSNMRKDTAIHQKAREREREVFTQHILYYTWKASTLPRQYCMWELTSFVKQSISQHNWKALPNLDFFLSFVVSVLTGFRLNCSPNLNSWNFYDESIDSTCCNLDERLEVPPPPIQVL